MFNITELRKRFPSQNLGYRERTILFSKGAKVKRTETQGMLMVSNSVETFTYTYLRAGYADFTVVG